MKIFIFEHVVGGGLAGKRLPTGLSREGGAMLQAAVADFVQAGHHLLTTLDERAGIELPEAEVTVIGARASVLETFDELAERADRTLVIAPESDHLLRNYVARLEAAGRRHLNSAPAAIERCADKLVLAGLLAERGIPTPSTVVTPDALGYPLVAKPRFGAGCEHTFVLGGPRQQETLPCRNDYIYQPYVPGRAVSASLLVDGENIQLLPAGDQILSGTRQLAYAGGRVPLEKPLGERANELAQRAVRAVAGLRGFVGVDLVLGEDPAEDQVIEINPRLTVSFVALRFLCHPALSQVMLDPSAHIYVANHRTLAFDPTGTISETELE